MRFRKTRSDSRSTYIYRFDDGTSVTLCPGENGVTEADIKMLHSLDDAEVYNNIKNSRPPMTSEEKVKKQRWQEGHPGERYSAGWNLSLDCAVSDCKDKGRILYEVSAETEYEEETAEEPIVVIGTDETWGYYGSDIEERRTPREKSAVWSCWKDTRRPR